LRLNFNFNENNKETKPKFDLILFMVETGEALSLPALRYFALPFLRDTTPVAIAAQI